MVEQAMDIISRASAIVPNIVSAMSSGGIGTQNYQTKIKVKWKTKI